MSPSTNNSLRGKFLSSLRAIKENMPLRLMICSLIVGLLAGYGALAFRELISMTQTFFYGFGSEFVVTGAASLPWWQIVIIPVIGGLIVGVLLKFTVPERRTKGVADVIETVLIKRGKMNFLSGIGSFFISAISLGTGASGGREGPVVHLGALLGSNIGKQLRLPSTYYTTLIGCGVASGVAASFNAPIAGMFFALEVVIGSFATQAVAPIVLASVIGTVVSRIHVGDFPAFIIPNYEIVSWWEIPAFALLGIVCAFVALLFIWGIGFSERTIDRFKLPEILRPASGGLILGFLALAFPQIIGVGYEATDSALKEEYDLSLLLMLIVIKTIAVGITSGSRFGGGFFSPALFVGAMTGGAFGIIASSLFPEMAASHGLYAILGMTAVSAAVLGAPISTILIVFELTGDYKISIAVMVTVGLTTLITKQLIDRSIFQAQLALRNVDLRENSALRYLKFRQVRGIMDKIFTEISSNTSMVELREIVSNTAHDKFVVIDANDHTFIGRIEFSDLKSHVFGDAINDPATAGELARLNSPVIFPESSLKAALAIMEDSGEDCLAVIDTARETRIIGLVHYKDLLREYNEALLHMQNKENGKRKPKLDM